MVPLAGIEHLAKLLYFPRSEKSKVPYTHRPTHTIFGAMVAVVRFFRPPRETLDQGHHQVHAVPRESDAAAVG
jgi:hypothetical protein